MFVSPWFLKIGVPAALAVILAVSIPVSLPVSVLVFGGLRGRARGQEVIADVVEDAAQTETPSVTVRPATFPRVCSVADSPEVSFRSSLLIQFTWKNKFSSSASVGVQS